MDLNLSVGIVQLTDWMINVAFQGNIVLLISFLIRWFYRKRSAPVRSDICLITMFLLLVVPIGAFVSVQLENIKIELLPQSSMVEEDSRSQFNTTDEMDPMIGSPLTNNNKQVRNTGNNHINKFNPMIQKDSIINISIILGSVWLMGITFMLVRLGFGLVYSRKIRSRLKPVNHPRFERIYASAIDILKLKKPPKVCWSSEINSPLTIGLLKPYIILPESLCQTTNDDALKSILLHEISHIYHKDHWAGLLQRIIVAFYWWHPLIYSLTNQFSMEREYICDSHAVKYGNPLVFAKSLLNLANNAYRYQQLPVALGIAPSKSALENRIKSIISGDQIMATSTNKKSFILRFLISVLLMAMLFSLNWTIAAQSALEKTATFDFIKNPFVMQMDSNQLYIAERDAIYIIGKGDYKLRKKITHKNFSKLGGIKQIDVKTKHLIVTKQKSLYIFDKNTGELKSKVFDYNNHHIAQVLSMGDKFVKVYIPQEYDSINIDICNNQIKDCKTVFKTEMIYNTKERVSNYFKKSWGIETTDNMLVMTFDKDFKILRFDKSGKQLPDIHREASTSVSISASFKENFEKRWIKKNEMNYWWLYPSKFQMEFPEEFPTIAAFRIMDGKIFVRTYQTKDNKNVCFVYHLDGTFIEKLLVPFKYATGDIRNGPVMLNNKKRFQLIKSDQEWQLFSFDVE